MRLVLLIVIPTLLLPTLAGGAAAALAAAPSAAPRTELFPWVPDGGYPDRFPFGQCTWWAAYNHPVNWSGDAKDWLTNAQAQGSVTSAIPSVGAVVVYRPGGLYSSLGHVAIVIAVSASSYIVSEMNAPHWGVVSTRTTSWPDPTVQGFVPRTDK